MRWFTLIMLLFACLCIGVALFPAFILAADEGAQLISPELMAQLLALLPASWEGWVTTAVAVCAALAVILPRPKEDSNIVLKILYSAINAVALNFGKAKNANAVTSVLNSLKK